MQSQEQLHLVSMEIQSSSIIYEELKANIPSQIIDVESRMTVTMSDCEEDGPATYLALNAMIRDQKKTSIFSFLERADEG